MARALQKHGLVSGYRLSTAVGNHKESLFLLSFTMLCLYIKHLTPCFLCSQNLLQRDYKVMQDHFYLKGRSALPGDKALFQFHRK